MTRLGFTSIALVVAFLVCSRGVVSAQEVEVTSNDRSTSPLGPVVQIRPQTSNLASLDRVVSSLSTLPLQINATLDAGYDDNFATSGQDRGAIFTTAQVTLTYARQWTSTHIGFVAGGGAVTYLSQRTDPNGFFDFSLNHKVSRRLILNLDVYAVYQSEPDFTTDAGPNRRAGNYLQSRTALSASYLLARRWTAVTGYTFRMIKYDDPSTAAFENRVENTFSEEIRYRLTRTTSLLGSYRLGLIDYDTASQDSLTHFLLAGVDQDVTRRLKAHLLAGATFRFYSSSVGDAINPHVEGSLDYALSRHARLTWTGSYSIEEPAESNALASNTFRTGLQLSYAFSARITSGLSFDYHHNENQAGNTSGNLASTSSKDAFVVSLNVAYRFSHNWLFSIRYDHSESSAVTPNPSYSRNRYSCGVTFVF